MQSNSLFNYISHTCEFFLKGIYMKKNIQVCLFTSKISPITNPKEHKPINIIEVYDDIRSGKFKDKTDDVRNCLPDENAYKKAKSKLPVVSFSGIFNNNESVTNATFLKSSSRIILDFDNLPNIDEVQSILMKLPFIEAVWISPSGKGLRTSGDGLKAIAVLPSGIIKSNDDNNFAFAQIYAYFYEKKIALDESKNTVKEQMGLDTSGKDVRRACFLCHDPDLFYNPNAIPFELNPNFIDPNKTKQRSKNTKSSVKYQSTGSVNHSHQPFTVSNNMTFKTISSMLENPKQGGYHTARYNSFMMLGGLVNAGVLDKSLYVDLMKISDSICDAAGDNHFTRRTETKACEDGYQCGLDNPVIIENDTSDTFTADEIKAFKTKISSNKLDAGERMLTSCLNVNSGIFTADGKVFRLDKDKLIYLKQGKGSLNVLCHFNEVDDVVAAGHTAYGVANHDDAKKCSNVLHQICPKGEFSIYCPNLDGLWLIAVSRYTTRIHNTLKSLNFKYDQIQRSPTEITDVFNGSTLHDKKREITLIANDYVAKNYQAYMLGGVNIYNVASHVMGHKKQKFTTQYPDFQKHIESLINKTPSIIQDFKKLDNNVQKVMQQSFCVTSLETISFEESMIKTHGVFCMFDPEGSGKTQRIKTAFNDYSGRFLAISASEALCDEMARVLDSTHYKINAGLLSKGRHNNRLVSCLNSLNKYIISTFNESVDVCFIDEILSVFDALVNGNHIEEPLRLELYKEIILLIKNIPIIYIADANCNQAVIDFITSIRPDVYRIESNFTLYKKPKVVMYSKIDEWLEVMIRTCSTSSNVDENGCTTIMCDSKEMAYKIEIQLIQAGIARKSIALLHGANKGGDDFRKYNSEFMSDLSKSLITYKVLLATPVIASGVSLTESVKEDAFCYFSGHQCLQHYSQMANRNRLTKTLHIFLADINKYEEPLLDTEAQYYSDVTSLDKYKLKRDQQNKQVDSNKLEIFIRMMQHKGYDITWSANNKVEPTNNKSVVNDQYKKEAVERIHQANIKLILSFEENRNSLNQKSNKTQRDSSDVERLNMTLLFAEDAEIDTWEKLKVKHESCQILTSYEIVRTDQRILKTLDRELISLETKKDNFSDKKDLLIAIDGMIRNPSLLYIRNTLKRLCKDKTKFSKVCNINLTVLDKELANNKISDRKLMTTFSRLCKNTFGITYKKTANKWVKIEAFDYKKYDEKRQKCGISLLKPDESDYAKLKRYLS